MTPKEPDIWCPHIVFRRNTVSKKSGFYYQYSKAQNAEIPAPESWTACPDCGSLRPAGCGHWHMIQGKLMIQTYDDGAPCEDREYRFCPFDGTRRPEEAK